MRCAQEIQTETLPARESRVREVYEAHPRGNVGEIGDEELVGRGATNCRLTRPSGLRAAPLGTSCASCVRAPPRTGLPGASAVRPCGVRQECLRGAAASTVFEPRRPRSSPARPGGSSWKAQHLSVLVGAAEADRPAGSCVRHTSTERSAIAHRSARPRTHHDARQ